MAYFEETYGPPWEGIDASQGGMFISNNALCHQTTFTGRGKSNCFLFKAGQLWNGFNIASITGPYANEPTKPSGVGLYTSYQTVAAASALTGFSYGVLGYYGDTRFYRLANGTPPAWAAFGAGSFPATTALFNLPSYSLPVQGFLYVPIDGGAILKVDAAAGTVTTLTAVTSCRYLGELGGHLLGAYTVEGVIPSTNFPYRLRWSGVYNFGQWNSAVDATAGVQDLSDVEDEITGLFTFGTVGYVLRQRGITQVNVTSNGTAPFQFDHLWKSNQGLGCLFPYTAAQFGPLGVFVGIDDVYILSSSGYEGIGGKAKNAIFDSLYSVAFPSCHITGSIIPHTGTAAAAGPALGYLLTIPTPAGGTKFWFYNFAEKLWNVSGFNFQASTFASQFIDSHSDASLADPDFGPAYYGDAQNLGVRGQGLIALGFSTGLQGSISQEGGSTDAGGLSCYFKVKCDRRGRKFTIHKIIVELYSATNPTFNLNYEILGSTTSAVLSGTGTTTWQTFSPYGSSVINRTATGERMQLNLSLASSSAVSIQRVTIIGNDGDGEQL